MRSCFQQQSHFNLRGDGTIAKLSTIGTATLATGEREMTHDSTSKLCIFCLWIFLAKPIRNWKQVRSERWNDRTVVFAFAIWSCSRTYNIRLLWYWYPTTRVNQEMSWFGSSASLHDDINQEAALNVRRDKGGDLLLELPCWGCARTWYHKIYCVPILNDAYWDTNRRELTTSTNKCGPRSTEGGSILDHTITEAFRNQSLFILIQNRLSLISEADRKVRSYHHVYR